MTIIDSNIIIYSYHKQYEYLRELLVGQSVYISEISRLEVLGYHKISYEQEIYFRKIFKYASILLPSQDIFDKAIEIRKAHNLASGDSLIAATGLVNNLIVYTRNIKDFRKVEQLRSINPII